jgi:microsomal dipeptidase-like Zn-dependent dipeptidase
VTNGITPANGPVSIEKGPEMSSDWRNIHKEATVFDLHAHPSLKLSLLKRLLTANDPVAKDFDPLSVRSGFSKLSKGGVNLLGSAITVPELALLDDCKLLNSVKYLLPSVRRILRGPRLEITLKMMEEIEKVANDAKYSQTGRPIAQFAHSVEELNAILDQGDDAPVALIHTVEGAHSLDENVENLDRLWEKSVASITLAHFYPNGVAPPVFPFPEYAQKFGCFGGRRDLTAGLTPLGVVVVEKMLELGMLIDITHCTPAARRQVFEIVGTKAPLLASHVGTYEINPNPYNLETWEAAKIADAGGVIGVISMNYWLTPYARNRGIDFISQTIRHFVSVAGEDHIAIGSDFDGFTDPPDDLKDASELPFLTQRLLSDGFTAAQTAKILGGNSLRVIREGWGKR